MRFSVLTCSLVALTCLFFTSTEAALHQEYCPSSMTPEQCKDYVEKKSKEMGKCHRYELSGMHIEWADCGRVMCGENMREVPSDMSKPYPDCCPTCEKIDPSKPGISTYIGK